MIKKTIKNTDYRYPIDRVFLNTSIKVIASFLLNLEISKKSSQTTANGYS